MILKISKIYHKYLTFIFRKKNILNPNPTNKIECCFCFSTKLHYPQMLVIDQQTAVDLCATLRRARAHDANDAILPSASPPSGVLIIYF